MSWVDLLAWWAARPWRRRMPRTDYSAPEWQRQGRPWPKLAPPQSTAVRNFPLRPQTCTPLCQPYLHADGCLTRLPRRDPGPYRQQGPGCVVFEER
jgi:hypothetical protein